MEIRNGQVFLSAEEVYDANSACSNRPDEYDPDFRLFTSSLIDKVHRLVPVTEQHKSEAVIAIPYTKRVVEMLSTAIHHGRELIKENQALVARYPETADQLRERYTQEERDRQKRRFKVIE